MKLPGPSCSPLHTMSATELKGWAPAGPPAALARTSLPPSLTALVPRPPKLDAATWWFPMTRYRLSDLIKERFSGLNQNGQNRQHPRADLERRAPSPPLGWGD